MTYQSCEDHNENVGKYTSQNLKCVHLETTGKLLGLIHDGKYTQAFRQYIKASAAGKKVLKGSVIHTFAAPWYLLSSFHHDECPDYSDLAAEILAWVLGSHHGMFDIVDENKKSGFIHRMETDVDESIESMSNLFRLSTSEAEIKALFDKSTEELTTVWEKVSDITPKYEEQDFIWGMTARLLLSALIDGDRRDTARFMDGIEYPDDTEDMRPIWESRLNYLESKLNAFKADTPINIARSQISEQSRQAAVSASGVFRLNVPTGAGKTLSGLRFALAHALAHNKKKLIFTAPLLSIIDQNSKVIRDYIGDDSLILEHHSDVIKPDGTQSEEQKLLRERYERMAETYRCPIIITTLVQLLNTMFDGKTTSIRRFHSLCDSVIIIDEVQSVPDKLLSMFNMAVMFLTGVCGATVVLCSATQPCLEKADHPLSCKQTDIVPYQPALWAPFKRTEIVDAGTMSLNEIKSFSESVLDETDSLLIVCNRKEQAETLFESIDADKKYHLSASMCMQHRKEVLDSIKKDQTKLADLRKAGKAIIRRDKIVCVSTQVVEAGVDISFGRVIRLTAGLPNAIQAFGRANRNGEYDKPVPAYIVTCSDEDLSHLSEIQRAKTASLELLEEFKRHPDIFAGSISSEASINYYYQNLYHEMPMEYQDCTVKINRDETTSLFSLLSDNRKYADGDCSFDGKFYMKQAFALAGQKFTVFDDDTTSVIVPYGEGERIYSDFFSEKAENDPGFIFSLLEKAKGYTVSVYKYQLDVLRKEKAIIEGLGGGTVTLLKPGYYDPAVGLSVKKIKEGRIICDALIK